MKLGQVESMVLDKIVVDGVLRSRTNALGLPIDHTDEGLCKFWRWFQNSCTIDLHGRPLVVYHGTNAMAYSNGAKIRSFQTFSRGGAFFSSSKEIAREYGESVYAAYVKIDDALVVDANGAGWSNIDTNTAIQARVSETVKSIKKKLSKEMDAILMDLFGADNVTDAADEGKIVLTKLRDLPGIDTTVTETDHIARVSKKLGYAGVIIRNVIDSPTTDTLYSWAPSDIYVATAPENIKSIENFGHWKNGDPLFCAAADGDEVPTNTPGFEPSP